MAWFFVAVMFLHGLIHLIGGIGQFAPGKIQGFSGQSIVSLPASAGTILGILWFIAVALFIVSAIALATKQPWWKAVTLCSIVLSQLLIVLWRPDAKWGTIPNILIGLGTFML